MKNNVNYWAFKEISGIICYSLNMGILCCCMSLLTNLSINYQLYSIAIHIIEKFYDMVSVKDTAMIVD